MSAGGHIAKRTYRRPDGSTYTRYRAAYPRPGSNPARSRKVERTFATRKEAQRWLTAEQGKLQRGEWVDPALGASSFTGVAEEWRKTWLLDGLAPKTRTGYAAILRRHVLPEFGEAPIAQVKTDAIQSYLARLARHRKPNTVRRIFTVIRCVFAVAVERRYIGVNPCDGVRLGRIRSTPGDTDDDERRYATERQARDLADTITRHYRTLVLVAAYTGARAGELRALRRRDYNPLKHQLHIRRAISEVTAAEAAEEQRNGAEIYGNLVFKSTKTYERRIVTLPRWLADDLDVHLAERSAEPDALIFTTAGGEPIRQSNFYRRHWQPAVRAALPAAFHGLRFHDLRHSHASWLIAKGAPAGHLMKRLGHKDIRTTFNIYGHLYPSDEEALAGLFDAQPVESANVAELRSADPL